MEAENYFLRKPIMLMGISCQNPWKLQNKIQFCITQQTNKTEVYLAVTSNSILLHTEQALTYIVGGSSSKNIKKLIFFNQIPEYVTNRNLFE